MGVPDPQGPQDWEALFDIPAPPVGSFPDVLTVMVWPTKGLYEGSGTLRLAAGNDGPMVVQAPASRRHLTVYGPPSGSLEETIKSVDEQVIGRRVMIGGRSVTQAGTRTLPNNTKVLVPPRLV